MCSHVGACCNSLVYVSSNQPPHRTWTFVYSVLVLSEWKGCESVGQTKRQTNIVLSTVSTEAMYTMIYVEWTARITLISIWRKSSNLSRRYARKAIFYIFCSQWPWPFDLKITPPFNGVRITLYKIWTLRCSSETTKGCGR